MSTRTIPYSFGERLGMFFPVQAGCLSAVAVSLILLLAMYKWLRRGKTRSPNAGDGPNASDSPDASDNNIFRNLMLADLIQALGSLPIIKWMVDGVITEGRLCTAQAVVKQVGIVGVAMSSLAITVHTFCVLILRWSAPRFISRLVVLMIWIFAALVIGIPNIIHMNERYYGHTGYWCWIKSQFKTEQIVTEYLWVWMAGLVMAILYPIMYVVMKGWFIVDDKGAWHWYKTYNPAYTGQPLEETEEEKETKKIAGLMLYYPAVYLICITPNTLSRWLTFSGYKVPYQYTFFANTLFSLSGLLNALLFFFTRPDLVIGPSNSPSAQEAAANSLAQSPHHKKDLSGYSSTQFGSLPPGSRSLAPNLVMQNLEYSYNGQHHQEPYNSMFLPNTAGSGNQTGLLHHMASDSGTYVSGERSYGDFRSTVSAPQGEEYGYRPSY